MITAIIQGTKDIRNTLTSLQANAHGKFRVLVEDSLREELSKVYTMEFVQSSLLRKYGKKSDLYWILPSGCLILSASWDVRINLCKKSERVYCLHPAGQARYFITNVPRNIGKWRGRRYGVPILQVTEV